MTLEALPTAPADEVKKALNMVAAGPGAAEASISRGCSAFPDHTPGGALLSVKGFEIHKARLSPEAQAALVEDLRRVAAAAPFFTPVTSRGQPMSVRMTSCGEFGWVSDRRGYRYEPRHPSGAPWPPIPEPVLTLWRDLATAERDPTPAW